MTSYRDKLYHHTTSNKINFNFLVIGFGKISSSKSLCYECYEWQNWQENLMQIWMLCSDGNFHRRFLLPRNSSDLLARIFKYISCLNVCRSDSHFVLWYSRQKNFVSYLISTQCWSLGPNKSFTSNFAIVVFCKTFYVIT